MIVKPEEMKFTDKTFSMILYGSPGIGKTTLALSAPKPVLIDFDRGIARVKAYHRQLTIVCKDYYEVLHDIESPEVKECETIVIDTGGSLVTFLQDYVMKEDPKVNQQKNGALSLKGYGAVKQEFIRLTNLVRDIMHKNIIYVFHSNEDKDKDGNPIQRLLCEGATRNIVWQPCDFGGYMQMIGNQRTISFTPTQEYFAKGCYGISGDIILPELKGPDQANNFLTKLFEKARENIAKENEYYAPLRDQYERTMTEAESIIKAIDSPEAATEAANIIPKMGHALTSLAEIRSMFSEAIKSLGYVWDKDNKLYKEADK